MSNNRKRAIWIGAAATAMWAGLMLALATLAGCGSKPSRAESETPRPVLRPTSPAAVGRLPAQPAQGGQIELLFPYGSEKELWLEAVTKEFNAQPHLLPDGRQIHVRAMPMGSGEMTEEILSERLKAHMASPASSVFVELGNAESLARLGRPLLGKTQNLVLSPVVIAMWRPMAEALGWPGKRIGWAELLEIVNSPRGWARFGYPQWGAFKFGHTHPEFSNSGMITLCAEAYAGVGKVRGLTLEDVEALRQRRYIESIERSVVHYGNSTGFFGRKLYTNGPAYLSAAVLYENMVIESHTAKQAPPLPIVAIYPKEGTFWSDHPVGIVDRPWVSDEHRQAVAEYVKFLTDAPQQKRAMEFGFRPADPALAVAAPIDAAHGVDPLQPETTLAVPSASVVKALLQLWVKQKKHANVVLVIDVSNSMFGQELEAAKSGAGQLVDLLGDDDRVSLLAFSDHLHWLAQGLQLATDRPRAHAAIDALHIDGMTSLYDAIAEAGSYLTAHPSPDMITAMVVLSDGEDTSSKLTYPALQQQLRGAAGDAVRVFTIGYGPDAKQDLLKEIAETTKAMSYEGSRETVREVFKKASAFF